MNRDLLVVGLSVAMSVPLSWVALRLFGSHR